MANFFFSIMLLFSFPMSGGKTDHPGHLLPHICMESHTNVNLCPVFYLKAYLRHTEPFRMKPAGSCVTSLFWVTIRQHGPVFAKTIFFLGKENSLQC